MDQAYEEKAQAQKKYWQAKFDEFAAQAQEASADTKIFIKEKLKNFESMLG